MSTEKILSSDGIPLEISLKKAERKNKLKALMLVGPLFLFLIITYIFPIGDMLFRSVDDRMITQKLPNTFAALEKWDGNHLKSAIAPTIYNRFLFEFLTATFHDELGEGFELFLNSQLQDQVLVSQINRENSVWWDDITTKNTIERRNTILEKSFKKAILFLENQLGKNVESWKWERVISVEHEHPIGKAGGLLRKIFNVGPFQTIGGNEVGDCHEAGDA